MREEATGVGLASQIMRGLCLLVLHIHISRQICEFPKFLQREQRRDNGTTVERVWEHGVRKQMTEFETEMTFQGHVWKTVSSSSGNTLLSRRVCVQWDEGQRYVVSNATTEEATDETDRLSSEQHLETVYSCVQFVARSPWVVQIRQSSPMTTAANATVCRGVPLVQDMRLLVSRETRTASVNVAQSCSLRGGFVIKPMGQSPAAGEDRMQEDPLCAGYRGEMRLESGCLDGEGTTFYFRHKHCIPDDLYMFSTQPTLCLGSWTDGPYAFSVLRHDRLPHAWVLRHPYVLDNSFTIYLFKDLVSPTMTDGGSSPGSVPGGVVGFLAVGDSPRPATSLCTDEHEACSAWPKPCLSSLVTTLTCPRTCGVCNASRPVVCSLPVELQGLWYDPETDAPAVLLNGTTLTMYGRLRTETHHCIDWESSTSGVHQTAGSGGRRGRPRTAWEAMLVNGFVNGCRPRYSCARFLRRAPFALYLKLSETQTWPLVSSPEEVIDCRGFGYDRTDDVASVDQNPFRDKHFRFVYSMRDVTRRTQCHLPEGLVDLDVTFSNGSRCLASLEESGSGATEFVVRLSDPAANRTCSSGQPTRVYQCLDSTDALPYSDLFLVTRTANETLSLWCWVFPRNRTWIFYQLRADQCNGATGRRIRKDRLNPHATYTTASAVNITTIPNSQPEEEAQSSYAEAVTTGYRVVQQNGPSSKAMTTFEGRKTVRDSRVVIEKDASGKGRLNETMANEKGTPISCAVVLILILICAVVQMPCT